MTQEYMKMMGLSGWIHWIAWFIKFFIPMLISIVLITALLPAYKIYAASLPFAFLLLLSYAVATIYSCFAISTFFSNGW